MSYSPAISALQSDVVHKICSGQVVITLASAVKELVENSIDSGATKIDVRLREYGSELIEVSDNGSGIREQDFDAITGKHSTSKIREFNDLHSVRTFGFRGEALSSLCQLSNLAIHTCAIDASVGTRLEFDSQGRIVTRRPLARSHGTTVFVHQLFHSLPVRRRHLTDPGRLTKEFAKAVSLLTAYCLSTVSVQISCSRITKSGEKIHVVSNGSATSIKDNLAAVYGQHVLNSLVELTEVNTVPNDLLDEFNVKSTTDSESIKVHGFITKPPTQEIVESSVGSPGSISLSRGRPGSSSGRSSSDRQFVYVNGRPCELPRLTRLATDIWRRCSREALASSTNGIRMPTQSALTQFPVLVLMFHMPTASVDVNLTPDKRMLLLHHERYVLALTKAILVNTLSQTTGIDIASLSHGGDLSQSMISPSTYGPSSAAPLDNSILTDRKRPSSPSHLASPSTKRTSLISIVNLDSLSQSMSDFSTTTPLRASRSSDCYDRSITVSTELIIPETDNDDSQAIQVITDELLSSMGSLVSHSVSASFSMSELHKRWHATAKAANAHLWRSHSHPSTESVQSNEHTDSSTFSLGQFRATQTEALESELSTYFSKSSFTDLQVVGQFNLGFIIALHRDDLFIIDQHASDEKFRFEQLCDTYQFTCQPLVTPQALELSVEQEQLLLNNLDVFAKNGFSFQVNESAPCGQQIQLTATPMLENKVFGRPDIEEMLFVLSESYSRRCRPSRLRDILASRSCRSAVMIGTALDHAKMLRIVRNMGTMHHPWNCPHGRPTMRHLFHLGRLGAE